MIAVYLLGLLTAFALGAVVESRRHICPDPVEEHARAMRSLGNAVAAARRWKARAEGHEVVLAALGRQVADGGTVDERHPSQRRGEAA